MWPPPKLLKLIRHCKLHCNSNSWGLILSRFFASETWLWSQNWNFKMFPILQTCVHKFMKLSQWVSFAFFIFHENDHWTPDDILASMTEMHNNLESVAVPDNERIWLCSTNTDRQTDSSGRNRNSPGASWWEGWWGNFCRSILGKGIKNPLNNSGRQPKNIHSEFKQTQSINTRYPEKLRWIKCHSY